MREKIRKLLVIIMGTSFGVFIGSSLWRWADYRRYPELYMVNSALWYTSVLVSGVFTAGIILVLGIIWWILGRKAKKRP